MNQYRWVLIVQGFLLILIVATAVRFRQALPADLSVSLLFLGGALILFGGFANSVLGEKSSDARRIDLLTYTPDVVRRAERGGIVSIDWYDVVTGLSLMLLGTWLMYPQLGASPLETWDESIYANGARHMVQDGYWLVPHLRFPSIEFSPYLEKPPLAMWLQAVAMLVFGVNEFAVRFPSATATVLTGGLVFAVGRVIFDRQAGAIATIVYYTAPYVHSGPNAGRTGATDPVFVLFGTVFVVAVGAAVIRERPIWVYVAAMSGAATVMVKGFGAAIYALIALPLILRNWRSIADRHLVGAGLISIFITAPWFLVAYARYGREFLDQLFFEQVLGRVTGGAAGGTFGGDPFFGFMNFPYFQRFIVFFDPYAFVFAITALIVLLRGTLRYLGLVTDRTGDRGSWLSVGAWPDSEQLNSYLFFTLWATAVLGFFAVTGNHAWYIMPMYVPAALIVGGVVSDALSGEMAAAGVILVGTVVTLANLPGTPAGVGRGILIGMLGLGIAVSSPASTVLRHLIDSADMRTLRTVLPVLVVVVFVFGAVTPVTPQGDPGQKHLGTTVERATPSEAVIYMDSRVLAGGPFYVFSFYADRSLRYATVERMNRDQAVQYAVVRETSLAKIERDYTAIGEARLQSINATVIRFEDDA